MCYICCKWIDHEFIYKIIYGIVGIYGNCAHPKFDNKNIVLFFTQRIAHTSVIKATDNCCVL